MKNLLLIVYSFLISLYFINFCYANQQSIQFKFDHENKITSPSSIVLVGIELQCAGKTLVDFYQEIAEQENFIGMKAKNELNYLKKDGLEWLNSNYQESINELIDLSTVTATEPEKFENKIIKGRTVVEIAAELKGLSDFMVNKITHNDIFPETMRQPIKDQIKILNKPKKKKSSDASSSIVQQKQSVKNTSKAITGLSSVALKKDKVISESEKNNEWQFVFKVVYEGLIGKSADILKNTTLVSTENKKIGNKSREILEKSIEEKKSYVQHLQDLLKAVKPVTIKTSDEHITVPEEIVVNKQAVFINNKSVADLYKLIMTEAGNKTFLIDRLQKSLQPEQVKQEFNMLLAEDDYCAAQKTKIKEAIELFDISKEVKKVPQSFGDAWLLNKAENKGTDHSIVVVDQSSQWNNAVDKLKECFGAKITDRGAYRLVPQGKEFVGEDKTLYEQEHAALLVKAIANKIKSIIDSMNFKMDGPKKIMLNLYPAPMEAFDKAWNALYVFNEKQKKYNYVVNGIDKELEDSQNIEEVKAGLLQAFAGMNFGTINKYIGDVVEQEENLPEDLVTTMQKYITDNKINVKDITMLKVFNSVTFPEGWMSMGPNGIQSPSGTIIPMKKVIEAVKGQDEGSGMLTEVQYNQMAKHLKGKPVEVEDDQMVKVMKEGKTYKEYKEILAGGSAPTAVTGISKEAYENLLQGVQIEMNKNKKQKLMSLKMTFTITQGYKDLKLPNDQEYTDMLFKALMDHKSYDDFMASSEYKDYLKDHPVVEASSIDSTKKEAEVAKKVEIPTVAIVVSKPIVNKDEYEEFVTKFQSILMRPNVTMKSVKMALNVTDKSGLADNEEQFGKDKDKLAQALFEKKTYEDYLSSLGGPAVSFKEVKPTEQVKEVPIKKATFVPAPPKDISEVSQQPEVKMSQHKESHSSVKVPVEKNTVIATPSKETSFSGPKEAYSVTQQEYDQLVVLVQNIHKNEQNVQPVVVKYLDDKKIVMDNHYKDILTQALVKHEQYNSYSKDIAHAMNKDHSIQSNSNKKVTFKDLITESMDYSDKLLKLAQSAKGE